MWYFVRTPPPLRWLFSRYTWRVEQEQGRRIYLTFDDGISGELTDFILDQLALHQAKATFFLVGTPTEQQAERLRRTYAEGHSIANHTQRHENGWKTPTEVYIDSVQACERVLTELLPDVERRRLFRPPYGRITPRQANALMQQGYEIVMWDVIAGDFDARNSPENSLRRLKKYARAGSIVVLHDNARFADHLRALLPALLQFYREEGYTLAAL